MCCKGLMSIYNLHVINYWRSLSYTILLEEVPWEKKCRQKHGGSRPLLTPPKDWNDNSAAMFEAKLKAAIARTATKIHLFEKLGFLTC